MLNPKRVHLLMTIICLIEVVLLSVASVSPSWHGRLFHGSEKACCSFSIQEDLVETGHLDNTGYSCLMATDSDEEGSEQIPEEGDDDRFCPVSYFSGGLVVWDEPHLFHPLSVSIDHCRVEWGTTIYLARAWRLDQARAPPLVELLDR